MSFNLKTTEVHKPRLPLIIWLVILLHVKSPSVNATVEVNKTESPSAQPRFGETLAWYKTVPLANGSNGLSGKPEGTRRTTVVSGNVTHGAMFLHSPPLRTHPPEFRNRSDVNKTTVQGHCNSSTISGSDAEGGIEWIGQGNAATCWWQIDITTVNQSGLVLQFDEVALRRGPKAAEDDTVTVFLGVQPDPSMELTRVQGSLPVSPILVPSALVLLRLEAYSWQSTWDDPLNSSYQHHSRFSLTYIAQSLHSLPPHVAQSTVGRYNCSAPFHVPPALLCDMVEQCAAGEDEENCSYKTTACDDWISHEHRKMCLKFVFPSGKITVGDGASECTSVYEGTLAELLDPDLKHLVANITSKSGHSEVLVGLQKVRNNNFFQGVDTFKYRYLWAWLMTSHLELDAALLITPFSSPDCAVMSVVPYVHFRPVSCIQKVQGFVCMKYMNTSESSHLRYTGERSSLKPIRRKAQEYSMKMCTDGSFIHTFQSCYFKTLIPLDTEQDISVMRLFLCGNGGSVPYSAVCNTLHDCKDGSDEVGCSPLHIFLYEQRPEEIHMCQDMKESVHVDLLCNGFPDCTDWSDEICLSCAEGMVLVHDYGCVPEYQYNAESALTGGNLDETSHDKYFTDDVAVRKLLVDGMTKAASLRILHIDGYGFGTVSAVTGGDCPDTHFRCKAGLCIPSYMVGDEYLRHCPIYSNDDEPHGTANPFITPDPCPGYFRCALQPQCIHWKYVCDGMAHCNRGYDELFCIPCPSNCTCSGFEYTCQQMFKPTLSHLYIKYLNLSHVFQPALHHVNDLIFLYYLNLSFCSLQEMPPLNIHYRLTVLDLSFNQFQVLSKIEIQSVQLRYLNLSNNPISNVLNEYSFRTFQSYINIQGDTPTKLPILSLSLRETNLQLIRPKAFERFHDLMFLDISRNSIKYLEENMFTGLKSLKTLVASDVRPCCVYSIQYSKTLIDCQAPEDELSSCEDLLRSRFLRTTLWLQSIMAVVGNAGVFVFRVFVEFQKTSSGFRVLVANLSVADLLMGLYMMAIGAADAHFSGQYVWKQTSWTESIQCKMAGFLAVLCSEMSAFIICIITVDRLLVLRFPFKKHLHLTPRSAMLVCAVSWSVALMLAAIPLFPITQHWMFYSQTGICLPLPITRRQFPGRTYSFAVFIVLNFVLFLLISVGQVFNYVTIRNTPTAGRTDRHQQDMTIARRLFLIVFTDFCCWFPVGVMGLLAARGIPIPGQVNVWTAVFVLPLNSALNPFLYTLNVLLENYMKRQEQRRLKHVLKIIRTDIMNWPEERVIEIIHSCDAAMKRFQNADNRGNEVRTTSEGRVEQAVQVTIETRWSD